MPKDAEDVADLPFDGSESTPRELSILQNYFTSQSSTSGGASEFGVKEAVYATLLFVVMANPAIDYLLDFVPHTGSPLIKAGIKAVIYFVLMYLIFLRM